MKSLVNHIQESLVNEGLNYKKVLSSIEKYLDRNEFAENPNSKYNTWGFEVVANNGLVNTIEFHDGFKVLAKELKCNDNDLRSFIEDNLEKFHDDLDRWYLSELH